MSVETPYGIYIASKKRILNWLKLAGCHTKSMDIGKLLKN